MTSYIERLHFYGWNQINKFIQDLNTNYLIIDYVDNYFINHNVTMIEDEWIGIIHHTKSNFSDNNIINLFKNIIFLNSLKNCKGLITLSLYNYNTIINELNNIYLSVSVYILYHPIPPNVNNLFNISRFEQNLNIINIGGWLRNPYTIFEANIYYNYLPLNKVKLKGYIMEQYFPTKDINYENIINNIIKNENSSIDQLIHYSYPDVTIKYSHPNNSINYFVKFLIDYINRIKTNLNKAQLLEKILENHNSVQIYEYLDNDQYLSLLNSSIIFCDYIDCSASNTILECIATATPIVLNKLPAIVEYLGEDYPLYFENIYNKDDNSYYLNSNNVRAAHFYLLNIRYSNKLTLDNFINKIQYLLSNKEKKKKKKSSLLL